MKKKLSLVIPCFQNELNIPHTGPALLKLKNDLADMISLEVTFVEDGSKDNTYQKLIEFHSINQNWTRVIKLTRNFGSSSAVTAGLSHSQADCYAFMSADLQDPPELILQMVKYWLSGIKLVIANRSDRPEGQLQKFVSNLFHRLIGKYGVPTAPSGGFDLMLFDRVIRDSVVTQNEHNAYLPYLVCWYGFPYVNIPFKRRERVHGKSSWSLGKKIKAFIDSFVAFTFLPIRMISVTGILIGFFGFMYSLIILFSKIFIGIEIHGWASLMIVTVMLGSFQIFSLGVLGEYIWRGLDSARRRPTFVVDKLSDLTS